MISIILTEFKLERASKYIGAMAMTIESNELRLGLPSPRKAKAILIKRKKITKSKNKNTTDKNIFSLFGLNNETKIKKLSISTPSNIVCCLNLRNID